MAEMMTGKQVIDNLKRLYDELDEASRKDDGKFDLDLLFLDVLNACGLMEKDNLQAVIGKEAAFRVLMMVILPENVLFGDMDG
jgi:hypothetical protein